MKKPNLPVGYEIMHKVPIIDFQMNRWVSTGYARREDFRKIAGDIGDFSQWNRKMLEIAKEAEEEGRGLNAACYYRGAEFFTSAKDPAKQELYRKFQELFWAVTDQSNIERGAIPYGHGKLPYFTYTIPGGKPLLIHGGFDSFIEEFLPFAELAANKGFSTILFEGPGQGGALHIHNLKMDYQWEKPLAAVFDYFSLGEAPLIGVSLGGYLGMRAAAFEKRISKIVAFNIIYDFYRGMISKIPPCKRLLLNLLICLKAEKAVTSLEQGIRRDPFGEWGIEQGINITGSTSMYDYFQTIRRFNTREISRLIDQDVLLTAGTDDIWTAFLKKQQRILSRAKSVTTRIFTREEQASAHCQVGNIELAINYILDWIAGEPLLSRL